MHTSDTVQFYCLDTQLGVPVGDFLAPVNLHVFASEADGTVAAISAKCNGGFQHGLVHIEIFEGDVVGMEVGGGYLEIKGISFKLSSNDGKLCLFAPTDGSILRGGRFLWSSTKNRAALDRVSINQIAPPNFTPGKMIGTPRGQKPTTELKLGDQVVTREHGLQEISWIGHRRINERDLKSNPRFFPILIGKGALGNGLPERDVIVGSNTRVLVTNNINEQSKKKRSFLVAAKFLTSFAGIGLSDCKNFCWTKIGKKTKHFTEFQ